MNKKLLNDFNTSQSKLGEKTTIIGVIVNTCLAILKFTGGFFGNSYALIADGIESLIDIVSSSLLLVGLKWSVKPPDKNHPYGHGKVEALLALFISLALVIAAFFIVKESIQHIQHPHKVPASYTLLILIFVIATKEILYRYVLKTANQTQSKVLKADAIHHRSDAITSIAAFIGISIALIGGKGYEVADDWAALFAACIIIFNAYRIARSAVGELLDEAISFELHEEIVSISEQVKGVVKVEQCHSRKMGTAYHVDMHLWVNGQLTVEQGHKIAHHVKNELVKKVPQLMDVHIHVEPN